MFSNLLGEELPGINVNAGLEQSTALHLSLVWSLGTLENSSLPSVVK